MNLKSRLKFYNQIQILKLNSQIHTNKLLAIVWIIMVYDTMRRLIGTYAK